MFMLETINIAVSYGAAEAVRDISFKVAEGSVVTLIGPNGAGKTTILNAISGIVPVKSGSILMGGQDITKMSAHRRVEAGLIHVPEGRLVLAGMTVRENLEMGGYCRPRSEVLTAIKHMEERFPILGERRHAMAGTLSGGEQQMLAIARGLMAKPKILLLDEPSLGLAPLVVKDVFDLICELKNSGQTILLVEQNARLALSVSSYAYVIESGNVVLQGPSKKLQSDSAVIRSYLGQAIS
ncbi:MAG: ABC transporter ATP-binding protein [Dissulfuribacterales bacterium]